ncbi:MAG: hypothetical protein V4577_28080 [Bacteroidota bacterium]
MKIKLYVLCLPALMLCFYACKKVDGVANGKIEILGKWNVVSDSSNIGVGIGNHSVDYTGKPGDYFDFRSDGHVYTKENEVLDTLDYSMISNTKIVISQFDVILNGQAQTSTITNFTSHSLEIAAPREITPGGVFGRSVKLSR